LLLLSFKHGELDWCQCAEAAVWSRVIVVVTPHFDGLARLGQGEENVLVEALVPQPAVERFDESVLRRLAGFDVVPVPTKNSESGEKSSALRFTAITSLT
jgi:hypothetical protein